MLQRVQKIVVTMDVQKDAQITVPAVISGTNATVDSSKMSDALDKLGVCPKFCVNTEMRCK